MIPQQVMKGLRGKPLKTTSGPPPKTQIAQAEEIYEELDRRDTETTAKEGLTLAQQGRKQIKKGRSEKMAKSSRLVQIEDSPSAETRIVKHPISLIVDPLEAADDEMTAETASKAQAKIC